MPLTNNPSPHRLIKLPEQLQRKLQELFLGHLKDNFKENIKDNYREIFRVILRDIFKDNFKYNYRDNLNEWMKQDQGRKWSAW